MESTATTVQRTISSISRKKISSQQRLSGDKRDNALARLVATPSRHSPVSAPVEIESLYYLRLAMRRFPSRWLVISQIVLIAILMGLKLTVME